MLMDVSPREAWYCCMHTPLSVIRFRLNSSVSCCYRVFKLSMPYAILYKYYAVELVAIQAYFVSVLLYDMKKKISGAVSPLYSFCASSDYKSGQHQLMIESCCTRQ